MRAAPGATLIGLLVLTGCRNVATTAAADGLADVTRAAGLTYRWDPPDKRPLNLLQTIGDGCAFLDLDGDGNLDVLLVGEHPGLFRGDGKGKFADATARLGGISGRFSGCAVGDIDNDGDPDLYLSGYREGRLLQNEGGRFVDVTAASGLKPQPWGTSAAFADVDGDGRLDLIVANYVRFAPDAGDRSLCDFRDPSGKTVLAACGPREYTPLPAALFRNVDGHRFVDITRTTAPTRGRGLGVAVQLSEPDRAPRIALANDERPGDLLRGGKKWESIGDTSGIAYDRDGGVHGGMGLDWGDYDNDGKLDLAIMTFQGEPLSLYRNEGGDLFRDVAYDASLGAPTLPFVAFGCRFLDIDNDGWLDIAITNGHVQDNVAELDARWRYRQPSQLFRSRGDGRFEDFGARAGSALTRPIVGRGLATGDYDNDGKVDLLLVDSEGEPILLHNRLESTGNWLGLRLIGGRSNRDAYGATVTATLPGGRRLMRHVHADGSYLSSSDPRIHLGVGEAIAIESLEIRWPSGAVQKLPGPAFGRYWTLREGDSAFR